MSIFGNMFGWLKPLGGFLKKAIGFVEKYVTDETIELAVGWVKVAEHTITDNDARREFVIKMLVGRGIPEHLARLAVELAVGIYKKEVEDTPKV